MRKNARRAKNFWELRTEDQVVATGPTSAKSCRQAQERRTATEND